ncbi:MAG: PP2C family protein-serine/threonine phosphatase [Candidatus Babeliales bacterium]|nr:PP2C family protein-serine/threonine phosphatase [Candidatus Babeliales bacterium]
MFKLLMILILVSSNALGEITAYGCQYNAKNIKHACLKEESKKYTDYFFAIYDGHETANVSDYLESNFYSSFKRIQSLYEATKVKSFVSSLFINCFAKTYESLDEKYRNEGSSVLVAYIFNNYIYIVNCGDSRAAICIKGQPYNLNAEHVPLRKDEMERIQIAGGRVSIQYKNKTNNALVNNIHLSDHNYIDLAKILYPTEETDIFHKYCKYFENFEVYGEPLVNRQCILTRAIGYKSLKNLVIPIPEIKKIALDENVEFVIMASSWFWKFISTIQAVEIIKNCFLANKSLQDATRELAYSAINKGAKDNITVILIKLK